MATYEIIIKDETTKVGNNTTNAESKLYSNKPLKNDNVSDNNDFQAKVVAKIGYDMANQFVISKVGEFTRDSLTQQKISALSSLGSMAMSFYVNPVLGAVNLASTTTSNFIDYAIKVQQQMNYNSVMLQRAGYINRSRN